MEKIRKIVLITGATAGIGEASAVLFAKNQWDIIITGRREERLTQLKEKLESSFNISVLSLPFDVSSLEKVQESIDALPEKWQQIDVLVNNAGLAVGKDNFADSHIADWERMIDTNVKGLLYMSKLVSKLMIQNGYGHIINVSSIAGKEVYAQGHVYCATKHAVDALCKGMRIDLLKYGIKVTSINPGAVETEFSVVRFKGDQEKADSIYDGFQPLLAEDVADTIYYAASAPDHVNIDEIIITCKAQAMTRAILKA